MEGVIERITKTLLESFPGARVDWDPPEPYSKLSGFLIWEGFEGKEQIKRQDQVWKALRKTLSKEDRRNIGAILTATPYEVTAASEE